MPMHEKVIDLEVLDLKSVTLVEPLIGNERLSFRVECFGPPSGSGTYRILVWRLECFRLQSSFPQEDELPAHPPSDHTIMVRDDEMIAIDEDVEASCVSEALGYAIDAIKSFVSRVSD